MRPGPLLGVRDGHHGPDHRRCSGVDDEPFRAARGWLVPRPWTEHPHSWPSISNGTTAIDVLAAWKPWCPGRRAEAPRRRARGAAIGGHWFHGSGTSWDKAVFPCTFSSSPAARPRSRRRRSGKRTARANPLQWLRVLDVPAGVRRGSKASGASILCERAAVVWCRPGHCRHEARKSAPPRVEGGAFPWGRVALGRRGGGKPTCRRRPWRRPSRARRPA